MKPCPYKDPEYKQKYNKKYCREHAEKLRKRTKKWRKDNAEYERNRGKKAAKKDRELLADRYIKQVIYISYGLMANEIPQILIELKRKQIQVKRLLKQ